MADRHALHPRLVYLIYLFARQHPKTFLAIWGALIVLGAITERR
jgi:hypothetical protein